MLSEQSVPLPPLPILPARGGAGSDASKSVPLPPFPILLLASDPAPRPGTDLVKLRAADSTARALTLSGRG